MRVLLLTDSLGCPRDEVKAEKTWTERIMKKWAGEDVIFYTHCSHGLCVPGVNMNYIRYIQPDVIICQIGIVDATRRALTRKELARISKVPFFSKVANEFCKKYHYHLSKIRNVHYTSKQDFARFIQTLSEVAGKKVIFIQIANPGKYLISSVYRIVEDVKAYNDVAKSFQGDKVEVINPYASYEADDYILGDGHHLNDLGLELVYKSVDTTFGQLIHNGE